MIELLVSLLVSFGGGVVANKLSPHPQTFSIERANCDDPQSRTERVVCDPARFKQALAAAEDAA
jgi:hypothetical protein